MTNNRSKIPSKASAVRKVILWGLLALVIAAIIFTNCFMIESAITGKGVNFDPDVYSRNWAITINLAILWLIFLYISTPSVKDIFNKLPQGLQFFVASAILGCLSGYFLWLVLMLVVCLITPANFSIWFDLLLLPVIAGGILSIVISSFLVGLLLILNKYFKWNIHNVIIRISLIAGCILGGILSLVVIYAFVRMLPQ